MDARHPENAAGGDEAASEVPPVPPLSAQSFEVVGLPDKGTDLFKSLIGMPFCFLHCTSSDVCTGKTERILHTLDVPESERSAAPDDIDISTPNFSYASYGDHGTTASLNADGNVLQITQYLGTGPSGFFSVDVDVHEPFWVRHRAEELFKSHADSGACVTFTWNDLTPEMLEYVEASPKLEFVRDRWPKCSYDSSEVYGQTQHFIRDGIVFARELYCAKNKTVKMLDLKTGFISFYQKDFYIREQEFLDSDYTFNEESRDSANYATFLGPHGYSFCIAHRGFKKGRRETATNDSCSTVVLIVSVSINGRVRELQQIGNGSDLEYRVKFDDGESFELAPGNPFEITVGCRLQLMPDKVDWKSMLIPVSEFLRMDAEFGYQSTPPHLTPYKKFRFTKCNDGFDRQFDFIIRRNLEHILSVCSIPVVVEGQTATAITCGDMSGHRLVTSASLYVDDNRLSWSL